ncbi:MAG TPA: hypothetical protein VKE91_00430 [Blastocatellia bacterium]|nr:hypothetical protein [Blastocatellia bacterium]
MSDKLKFVGHRPAALFMVTGRPWRHERLLTIHQYIGPLVAPINLSVYNPPTLLREFVAKEQI